MRSILFPGYFNASNPPKNWFRSERMKYIVPKLISMEPTENADSTPTPSTDDTAALKEENANLKSQIESLTFEIESLRTEKDGLNFKVTELNSKLTVAEQETEKITSNIAELESNVNALTSEKNGLSEKVDQIHAEKAASDNEVTTLKSKVEGLENEMNTLRSSSGNLEELQNETKILKILASTGSSAMDMYTVLKSHKSLSLRKLSMQAGMASSTCLVLLEGLEKAGLIKFERAGPDDTDPKITLIT